MKYGIWLSRGDNSTRVWDDYFHYLTATALILIVFERKKDALTKALITFYLFLPLNIIITQNEPDITNCILYGSLMFFIAIYSIHQLKSIIRGKGGWMEFVNVFHVVTTLCLAIFVVLTLYELLVCCEGDIHKAATSKKTKTYVFFLCIFYFLSMMSKFYSH